MLVAPGLPSLVTFCFLGSQPLNSELALVASVQCLGTQTAPQLAEVPVQLCGLRRLSDKARSVLHGSFP